MIRKHILRFITAIVLLLTIVPAVGAIPGIIAYQGLLTDQNGTPLEGNFDLHIKLYDTEAGSTAIWHDTYPQVNITNGVFAILLGSGANDLSDIDFNQQLWLGITVADGQEMTPRIQLASVATAFLAQRALVADSLSSGASINASALTLSGSVTGDLTVDNKVQATTLDISGNASVNGTFTSNSLNINGTGDFSGAVIIGNSDNSVALNNNGQIELSNTSEPFIDFKSATTEDFDARITKVSDGLQFHTGGNGVAKLALALDSGQNASFTGELKSGTVNTTTLKIGNTTVKATAAEINSRCDGIPVYITNENSSSITVTDSSTLITTIDLGSVKAGDYYYIEASIRATKGSTNGKNVYLIEKESGEATIIFPSRVLKEDHYIQANDTYYRKIGGMCYVSGSGTLVMKASGVSIGSNSMITGGSCDLAVTFLKKQ